MALSLERWPSTDPWRDDDAELLTRYMRALLRSGDFTERPRLESYRRTCVRCGAFTWFEPVEDADTWTACVACGGLA